MTHWTDEPHAIMRQHIECQLARALDAAVTWLSPREAGACISQMFGEDDTKETELLAKHIEEAVVLLRKWRSQ